MTSAQRLSPSVRVLVVDDDAIQRELATSQLAMVGCDPIVVETAAEAVQLLDAADHGVALVLMDRALPDMDGLEATRRIRAHESERSGHVPIVAVTARATDEDRAASRHAGMDDFVAKPLVIADIEALLARWTPWGRADGPSDGIADSAESGDLAATLDALADDLGDHDAVCSLVDHFLLELPVRQAALHETVASGDTESARRVAHTLGSTSALFGLDGLRAICRSIEREIATTFGALEELDDAVQDAAERLRSWRNET